MKEKIFVSLANMKEGDIKNISPNDYYMGYREILILINFSIKFKLINHIYILFKKNYPTISLSLKKKLISLFALSSLSEPCTEFSWIDIANFFLMVPFAALSGFVSPMILL